MKKKQSSKSLISIAPTSGMQKKAKLKSQLEGVRVKQEQMLINNLKELDEKKIESAGLQQSGGK